jgi:hypothetical protein
MVSQGFLDDVWYLVPGNHPGQKCLDSDFIGRTHPSRRGATESANLIRDR